MDSLINAAAQALAAGNPFAALNRVALRGDAPALALRGIAMARIGNLERARVLLRAAGCASTAAALSTSAVRAGMPAWRAAWPAWARAARASLVRSRRMAMPATTISWAARPAGVSSMGSRPLSIRSASASRPMSSRRRTWSCLA
jgi:hypothetical protein